MAVKTSEPELTKVGPYDLLEKLGEGGMGVVHKARHGESGELVAVKIILGALATDPKTCRRMEQEYRAASSLRHPHIVQGLDFGLEGPYPYFVMELVDGESLGDRICDCGPLSEDEALQLLIPVAEAIQLAHKQNYIHRDIKPDNILITSDGQAKITDLGLVKSMDGDVNLTVGCTFVGTPNYAAPEQLSEARRVDVRADIYSLGATFYTAVTGMIPFSIRRKKNYLVMLKKKLQNELVPPREIVPSLSPAVDFAIRRAMRADKSQRQSSCEEFIAGLLGKTPPEECKTDSKSVLLQPAIKERRGAERHRGALRLKCEVFGRNKEKSWKGMIHDISTSGVRMVLPRRFEPGTRLILEVEDDKNRDNSFHLMQVIRVRKESAKEWTVAGTFIRPLTASELKTMLNFRNLL